jgi:hypothetical protein
LFLFLPPYQNLAKIKQLKENMNYISWSMRLRTILIQILLFILSISLLGNPKRKCDNEKNELLLNFCPQKEKKKVIV